jgi:hypothetical protein
MDKLAQYRQNIQKVLQEYAAVPISNGQIDSQTIFDIAQDHYQVLDVGWNKNRQVHSCALHLDIMHGKIWVQHNMTEMQIAQKLMEQGVSREDIVLGLQAPSLCP